MLYRYGTAIVAAMVVVQIGSAGFGAFNASEHVSDKHPLTEHTFDDGFSFHTGFGYALFMENRTHNPGILKRVYTLPAQYAGLVFVDNQNLDLFQRLGR